MIKVHSIKGDKFYLNSFHIEKIEARPDTVITLTNEKKFVVRESPDEIIELITMFQKKITVEKELEFQKPDE